MINNYQVCEWIYWSSSKIVSSFLFPKCFFLYVNVSIYRGSLFEEDGIPCPTWNASSQKLQLCTISCLY